MKHKHKKPTRAEKEARSDAPKLHKCDWCGFKSTRYGLKQHAEVCNA